MEKDNNELIQKNKENGRSKDIIILILTILLIGCAVYILYLNYKPDNKKTTKLEEKPDYKINEIPANFDKTKYSDYTFTNVKIYDESTNGKAIYSNKKEWIEYEDNKKLEVNNCFNEGKYLYELKNGTLTVTNISTNAPKNDSYTFTKITNIKLIMEYFESHGCDSNNTVILTNDGKVYYRNGDTNIKTRLNYQTIESQFKLFDTKYKIEKIGYSSYDNASGLYQLGALTSTGEQINLYLSERKTSDVYGKNIADFISCAPIGEFIIENDGSIMWGGNLASSDYLKNEDNKKIYVNYSFGNQDKQYIIDKQGYLYAYNTIEDLYGHDFSKSSTITLKKYSDKRVFSIGTHKKDGIVDSGIIVFEDGSYKKMDMSVDFGFN